MRDPCLSLSTEEYRRMFQLTYVLYLEPGSTKLANKPAFQLTCSLADPSLLFQKPYSGVVYVSQPTTSVERKKVFQENKYINSFPTVIQLKGTLEATNPHLATLQRQHITVTHQRGEDQKRFHLREQKKSLEKCCVSFCNKVSSKWRHRAELPRGTYYCGGSLRISGQQNQIGNLFRTY